MSRLHTPAAEGPERWISFRHRRPAAELRLFCLPHAGGGASAFRRWQSMMPATVEICPVQPPGRESRIREAPFSSATELVEALDEAVQSLFDLPFVLLGYSMGATIAFEWAHHLRRERGLEAELLCVVARAAPHVERSSEPTYLLPDDDLKTRLRELAGTPAEILDNEEMMEVLLPLLRADFQIHDTYAPRQREPLSCPVIAYGGRQDEAVPERHLQQWRAVTAGPFQMHLLPGDHFSLLQGGALAASVGAACEALRR